MESNLKVMAKLIFIIEEQENREASKIEFEVPNDMDIWEYKRMCIRMAGAMGYASLSVRKAFGKEYLIGFLLIILLPASILFNIILLIRGINIVKQNEQLVDTIVEYDNKEIATQSNLESMLSKMKEIDIRGSFESDDEVGAVFSELKETIENYKTKSNNA